MKAVLFILSATIAVTPLDSSAKAGTDAANDYKSYGSISDFGLRAIDAAKPEFVKQGGSTEPYTVDVDEIGGSLDVTFCLISQKQTLTFTDGDGKNVADWPRCPGSFTVELDKTSLKVLKTHYNRD